ncbi:MAG: phage portal protein [Anaerolineae bacterium]|nr:phage portal protein [Anaerolineae bacterium]
MQVELAPGLYLAAPLLALSAPEALRNVTVSACMRVIAASAGAVPPQILSSGVPDEGHPAAQIFRNLGPEPSWPDLVFSLVADYFLYGQMVLYSDGERLVRLPAALVTPVLNMDKQGRIRIDQPVAGFSVSAATGSAEFSIDEVAWIAHRRPDRPWEVIPPVHRLLPLIAVDNILSGFFEGYIRNGGMVPFLLISDVPLPESRIEEFKRRWQERSMREMEQGIPPVLSRMRVERVGASVRDMGIEEIQALVEAKICMEMGVPPVVVGAMVGLRYSSYANYRTALIAFRQNTVLPLMRRIAEGLTVLLRRKWPEVSADYDWRKMESVVAMGDRAETAQLYQAGLLTLDEARAELGYPPAESAAPPARRVARPSRKPGGQPVTEPSNDFIGRREDYPDAEYGGMQAGAPFRASRNGHR